MTDRDRTALLVVDVQHDFLPGGALAIDGGHEILEPLRALLEESRFGIVVATQDWHPKDHISFASRHPEHRPFETIELYGREQVLWPDHCVAATGGAELHPLIPWVHACAVIRKGTDPAVDSYSAFRNNWNAAGERPPTGLAGYLRERGVRDVFVCGLARDFCVKWSAEDASDLGFGCTVLWDLTRAVDPTSDAAVRAELAARGVRMAESTSLAA